MDFDEEIVRSVGMPATVSSPRPGQGREQQYSSTSEELPPLLPSHNSPSLAHFFPGARPLSSPPPSFPSPSSSPPRYQGEEADGVVATHSLFPLKCSPAKALLHIKQFLWRTGLTLRTGGSDDDDDSQDQADKSRKQAAPVKAAAAAAAGQAGQEWCLVGKATALAIQVTVLQQQAGGCHGCVVQCRRVRGGWFHFRSLCNQLIASLPGNGNE